MQQPGKSNCLLVHAMEGCAVTSSTLAGHEDKGHNQREYAAL